MAWIWRQRQRDGFTVRQVATNQKGALVCEAKIVYVTLTPEGRPMPVPEEWRAIFSPWEG